MPDVIASYMLHHNLRQSLDILQGVVFPVATE